jgi:uridine phosphorylase
MPVINKANETLGKKQLSTKVSPADSAKYALLPGDPARVLRAAKYLDDAHEVAYNREFRTWVGFYKGIKVIVTSTGVGCPSASIVVEELANIGVTHFIRIGSTAALQEGIHIGDLIINTACMRNEGTTRFYVKENFPGAADPFLMHALIDTARMYKKERGFNLFVGLNSCDDSFYGETPEWIEMLHKHKLLNVEMESAAVFVVAHMRGVKAAMIAGVSANLFTGEHSYAKENTGLVAAWENEIEIALESIVRYETHPEEYSI